MTRTEAANPLRGAWCRSERGIYRDRACEQVELCLSGRMRLVDCNHSAQRILYVDLSHGAYRELVFDDAPGGVAGTVQLRDVSVDYVKRTYRRTAALEVTEGSLSAAAL